MARCVQLGMDEDRAAAIEAGFDPDDPCVAEAVARVRVVLARHAHLCVLWQSDRLKGQSGRIGPFVARRRHAGAGPGGLYRLDRLRHLGGCDVR